MGERRVLVPVQLLIKADLYQDPNGALHTSAFWDAQDARRDLLKIVQSKSKHCPDCRGKGYINNGSENGADNHWTNKKTCAGCEGRRIVPK